MSEAPYLWMLAGVGVWTIFVFVVALGIRWHDERRQQRLADHLAALRFEEISPADYLWARANWPANTARADRIARGREPSETAQ